MLGTGSESARVSLGAAEAADVARIRSRGGEADAAAGKAHNRGGGRAPRAAGDVQAAAGGSAFHSQAAGDRPGGNQPDFFVK